ncbi:hypothetical protein C6P40_002858 [Pichia californica]|uniref:Metallo-beta-lactamase domain-containing protein n=1 Tax=Pichia californica TaxID=460514 RepID=A0A9P7BEY6_9ASCO|nr:hypothetical protein C6P42_001805 [[Candida] californica]KAG0687124.1 hypothetical protein C6P40_002858 [[Candida] californica]
MAQREIKIRDKEFKETGNDNRFEILEINGRFENPFKEYRPQTLYEFFIMRLIELSEFGPRGGIPNFENLRIKELNWVKSNINDIIKLKEICKEKKLIAYTWLGQSCALFQSNDKIFLLDPLFENSIVNEKFGPKRIVPVPISINEIVKEIKPDYILVSHDHPDHLGDKSTIELSKLNLSKWIVPIGIKKFLNENGILNENIIEMKWWERKRIDKEFEIVCLPTMHWSGRILIDSNKSLWCSFLIIKNNKSLFYHGGDTGYSKDLFKKIGLLYGPIKFGALPIGQYCPEWHQKPRHISPLESIKIMNEMKIHKIVGVHWGTFILSSENYLEPGKLLNKEAKNLNLINNIIVPNQGKILIMNEDKIDFEKDDEIEFEDDFKIIYK